MRTLKYCTGQWREAYFEIPEIKFNGVNHGPQAAVRFVFTDKIFFSRIRHGIIRPCGPFAGINPLEACKPSEPPTLSIHRNESGQINVRWTDEAGTFQLESTRDITADAWAPFPGDPTVNEGVSSVSITIAKTTFFRLLEAQ
ncbi:MAG: hypothetical protein ACJ0BN_08845 [Limisphaerales bacterium]